DNSDPFAVTRQGLPGEIMPGQTCTFTFNMTAPSNPGVYTTDWQMLREGATWFGDKLSKKVTVGTPELGAVMVSNTIPDSAMQGETKSVSVTVKNVGNKTWTAGEKFVLGACGDGDPFASTTAFTVPKNVAKNETVTFTFNMSFPTAGTFTTDWQMAQQYVTWFGDKLSKNVTVTPVEERGAILVSNTIPDSANLGETRSVSITFRNVGSTTWTPETFFRLSALDDSDPFAESHRYYLDRAVPKGDTYTFTFDMHFNTAGTHTTDWQMVQDGVTRFGDILRKSVTVSAPEFGAQIIGETIPTSFATGETKKVTVTVKNTGSATWSQATEDMLGSLDNYDPFSLARIGLDTAERRVAPGETYTFTFYMTAPANPGVYTTDWQMIREHVTWFGDIIRKDVTVTAAEHSAQMISNTIPDSANADEVRTVSVTVKNTGTVTWTPEALFRLGAVDNNDPFYHAEPPRAYLDRAVAPGETYTFTFDMEFGEPGTYTTDWKMVQDGNDWFGQVLAKQVTVNRPEFNARIISDNIPTTMIVGQTKTVSVTVKNTGSATWSQGTEDMLGSPDNYDPFSLARIGLDTAERRVAPGETYTFTFPMTAPSKAGTYTTDWQMIREYVTWFGDVISKEIKVNEVGNAHTYYVATNGNDNNAGTEAAPWKTITNGDHKKILAPGDTVIVKAGTYTVTDCMNDYSVRLIECDGTAKYPITYKAQGTVKIVNNNSKNGNHDSHTTCLHVSSEHIVLDGFDFQGGVSPLTANYKFTGLIVKNCKIHDSDYITTIWPQSTGIYQENNNPITVENCEIYNIGLNAPGECFGIYNMGGFFNGSAGVSSTYHHNYIHNVKGGALSSRGGNCNDRFLNNTVVDCTSYGVRVNSGASINGSVTAKNNIFVNCGTAISLENGDCVANNSYNLFWNLGGGITNGTMGEGSVIANPSFTTAPTIADSSPAVNKGVDVGYAYKGGAPDMGCYETSYNRGVIYYVATNGNDDNAGTSSAPWKTILNGDHKKILRPGDTVIVKAGTYTVSGGYNDYDVRLIEVGGTADYPITYKAQGTVKVVNNGSGNEGHNKLTCSLHVSADYIILDGFEFTGGVAGVAANYRAKGMVVKNCKIHDTDYMTTIFPQSAGIYYGELDTIGLTVENCEIYNIGLNAPGEAYGIYNMSNYFNELPGSQSVMHHNYIHNIRGGALSVRGGGTNDLFLNNTCVDCVMFGVRTHIGDKIGGTATAKNNIFVNCGTALAQDNSDCGITNSNNLIWSCTSPTNGTLGANTVQANPKFTTAPTIASDSPAVNTGVNVGYAYKGTAPDMGCY
ncbi:MAG: right-handed parallel beta-helix repeat-containing protein, partial [Abditibacteriota bacterium]|nr:right-handed parallel beta-helix repeat-containing protein [Abditibacteriota bacterium]